MECGKTRYENDVAGVSREHPGQHGIHTPGGTFEIDLPYFIPCRFVQPKQWCVANDSSGANQQVDRSRIEIPADCLIIPDIQFATARSCNSQSRGSQRHGNRTAQCARATSDHRVLRSSIHAGRRMHLQRPLRQVLLMEITFRITRFQEPGKGLGITSERIRIRSTRTTANRIYPGPMRFTAQVVTAVERHVPSRGTLLSEVCSHHEEEDLIASKI